MNDSWIVRKQTKPIFVGDVGVGGNHPISIQSMTNTNTADVQATVDQIEDLQAAGADIVRVSVPDEECAAAFKKIKKAVSIPLVADIHFDYKIALLVADSADCLRINPGNIGKADKVKQIIQAAKDNNVPIRIGVNAGSLEKDLQKKYGEPNSDALVESALRHVDILDKHDFQNFKLSLKASNIKMTVESYRKFSKLLDQPLHLGITESGSYRAGSVKSSIGLGLLLGDGIGETSGMAVGADPGEEIRIGGDSLESLNRRSRGIRVVACHGCSREDLSVIEVVNELENRFEGISEDLEVAIIGCYVNGPGESKAADVGLTGGPSNLLYVDGSPLKKVSNEKLVDTIEDQVREKLESRKVSNIIVKG